MNKRNWLVLLLVGVIAITSFNSCKKDEDTDNKIDNGPTEWTRATVFSGAPRIGASTFTLNNVAYVVGGWVKPGETISDIYAFDGKGWTKKKDFEGEARHSAVGFAINNKGYYGLGSNGSDALKDFYEFDATTNQWTKIDDFPGQARYGAVAFSIGNKAYVGLGSTRNETLLSDFYEFDGTTKKWTALTGSRAPQFTDKKAYAFSFVINGKAYVGGGTGNVPEEFWSFDGTEWKQLKDIKSDTQDIRRSRASAFAIDNFGYVVSGRSTSGVVGGVWKYNPVDDTWTDKHQSLEVAREQGVGFALDKTGYITTGSNSSGGYLYDNWKFVPVR
ncbi:Kelch repeat-containing protein [Sphingobacterium humi]|uniref:Galactose oxidase n=1 Tax=Sphingobacterium humi TaxID=1796905 RepID=A0A6N8KWG3_9SPHI|nr:kelch repeat-containing protein [Sphingobacterium humi]MVZ61790.1 hypothetical protein [Sphingobacterium humi]